MFEKSFFAEIKFWKLNINPISKFQLSIIRYPLSILSYEAFYRIQPPDALGGR